ncbi:vesicle transport protein GOT1 [Heracleum sosnowskyi]|uniref:Vesicle transport protein GOT1 n=1 Tax=Heracleum sosnowskyi TaxID=360622 RepID=A0AAD8I5F4_9APIA|nr:vesicle transport protein GOT1 [Heracleum sosnowskyi]
MTPLHFITQLSLSLSLSLSLYKYKVVGHLFHGITTTMLSFEMNDRKKIGLGLTGFGIFFSFLGIVFFFDKGLIAMGNILFVSGVMLTIGLQSSLQFFMKRSNYKGTISFETYGFIILFSGFWPTLAVFVQKIPIIGWCFNSHYQIVF